MPAKTGSHANIYQEGPHGPGETATARHPDARRVSAGQVGRRRRKECKQGRPRGGLCTGRGDVRLGGDTAVQGRALGLPAAGLEAIHVYTLPLPAAWPFANDPALYLRHAKITSGGPERRLEEP